MALDVVKRFSYQQDTITNSHLTDSGNVPYGKDTSYDCIAQSFTATKDILKKVVLKKSASFGIFTGDVVVSIYSDDTGEPNLPLTFVTIPNATYEAISDQAEFEVDFNYEVTSGTRYWIYLDVSTAHSDANYPKLRVDTAGGLVGETLLRLSGSTWVDTADDLYFKVYETEDISSIATVNGIALASLDTWNGLTVD